MGGTSHVLKTPGHVVGAEATGGREGDGGEGGGERR